MHLRRRMGLVQQAGSDGYGLWNADWTSFRSTWETWSAQGLRLINFKNTPSGIEAAFAPVANEGYAVGTEEGRTSARVVAPAGGEVPVDEETPRGFGGPALGPEEGPTAEDLGGAGYGAASFGDQRPTPTSHDNGHGYGAAAFEGAASRSADDAGSGHGAASLPEEVPGTGQKARRRTSAPAADGATT